MQIVILELIGGTWWESTNDDPDVVINSWSIPDLESTPVYLVSIWFPLLHLQHIMQLYLQLFQFFFFKQKNGHVP